MEKWRFQSLEIWGEITPKNGGKRGFFMETPFWQVLDFPLESYRPLPPWAQARSWKKFWKPPVKTGSSVGLPGLFYVCMGFLCFSYIIHLIASTINPKILTIFRLIIGRPWKPCRMMFESLRRIALMSCEKSRCWYQVWLTSSNTRCSWGVSPLILYI